MKKAIFLLIVLAGIIEGCKYDEGPLISFHSSWNRLQGNHTLIKYTVDGVDSLSLFNDSLSLDFYFWYSDSYGEDIWQIVGQRKDGKDGTAFYEFNLVNNSKDINIGKIHDAMGTGPFGYNVASWNGTWEIIKLEKKDIRLGTTYNGKQYNIELN